MDKESMVAHVKQYRDLYHGSVLRPEVHSRLVQSIDRIAAMAKIPRRYILTTMQGVCSEAEIEWVKNAKHHANAGVGGLVYVGKRIENLEERMMLIAGCLIRNFLDARVYTVQEVISQLKEQEYMEPRILLIPNFFLKKDAGGDIPSWQVSGLLGMLYQRFAAQKLTVLYVQSLHSLRDSYGESFSDHITRHYTVVEA